MTREWLVERLQLMGTHQAIAEVLADSLLAPMSIEVDNRYSDAKLRKLARKHTDALLGGK